MSIIRILSLVTNLGRHHTGLFGIVYRLRQTITYMTIGCVSHPYHMHQGQMLNCIPHTQVMAVMNKGKWAIIIVVSHGQQIRLCKDPMAMTMDITNNMNLRSAILTIGIILNMKEPTGLLVTIVLSNMNTTHLALIRVEVRGTHPLTWPSLREAVVIPIIKVVVGTIQTSDHMDLLVTLSGTRVGLLLLTILPPQEMLAFK